MNKWGLCLAERRPHELKDFKSQAVYVQNRLVGHREVCRFCNKPVSELINR